MKFTIDNKTNDNPINIMRELGYHLLKKEADQFSLVKSIGSNFYPRFHVYLEEKDNLLFNLHLDQREPRYKGTTAHNAEYNGEIIEKEKERIVQGFDN